LLKILLILFITIPILEIYLLISIGSIIGALPTIMLIIFTALLGVFFLRWQGLNTLVKIRTSIEHKEVPATDLIEGLILLISGVLLLTPGFVTDTLGFLCLVPGVRRHIAVRLLNLLIIKGNDVDVRQRLIIEGEFNKDD
jgi:UPF0716 protein FxsA